LFGNEERLMPYFLRHYAGEADRLFMLDGGSRDGSRELIKACPKATVEASPFAEGGYDEQKFVDYLSERCWAARNKADLVMVVDADEFLYDPRGLRAALSDYGRHGIRTVKMQGYQMAAEVFPEDNGQRLTELVWLGVRDEEYDKVAAFDPGIEVEWSPGRHNCRTNVEIASTGMKLLHYRYFGEEWLRERNAGNFARRSEADAAAGRGFHCGPEHAGKYSPEWWKQAALRAEAVVG
jgi:hypothetical protein